MRQASIIFFDRGCSILGALSEGGEIKYLQLRQTRKFRDFDDTSNQACYDIA